MRTITRTGVLVTAAAAFAILSLPAQAITTPSVKTTSTTYAQWSSRRSRRSSWFHRHHRRHHRMYHRMRRSMSQRMR